MKTNNKHLSKKHLKSAITRLAFCGFLGAACAVSLADNGRGSIRASNRPEPPPRAPAPPQRPPPRQEPPPRPAPDDHNNGGRPDDHKAPPPPNKDNRGGWDDHDDNRDHWGGYGRGTPARFARGQRFHDLPGHHVPVIFGGISFFYCDDGSFYQVQPDGQYLCVQPPVGAIVPAIPDGCIPIAMGDATVYYIDGVYFVPQPDGTYAVVNPPQGIVVPVLPSGATQLVFKNVVFFQFNGYNYTPSIQDGVTVYTVTLI